MIYDIPLKMIYNNPWQTQAIDPAYVAELAADIERNGRCRMLVFICPILS